MSTLDKVLKLAQDQGFEIERLVDIIFLTKGKDCPIGVKESYLNTGRLHVTWFNIPLKEIGFTAKPSYSLRYDEKQCTEEDLLKELSTLLKCKVKWF